MLEVPDIDALRMMSDLELARLRTELTYATQAIHTQLEADADKDDLDGWKIRANAARNHFTRGLAAIKNINAERKVAANQHRILPLAPWMSKLSQVYAAASALLLEDSDENWDSLEAALATANEYLVSHDFISEAMS